MTFKTGTRIEIKTHAGPNFSEMWETGRVIRHLSKRDRVEGWVPVCFDRDGAKLMVHVEQLRLAA